MNRERAGWGRAARTTGRIVRETLLTVAALGGAACIVLVILAFTGGYSLIMFKTGSMSPTIPTGSVALVREIPASEAKVGDVLTVDRPGKLPVTHRVTSVAPADGDPSERVITLKGDANQTEDPEPYRIDHARLVVGSVPGLATVIVWFGSPWIMGGITIAAAVLVTWAFWPREREYRERRPAKRSAAPVASGALALAAVLGAGGPLLLSAPTPAGAAPVVAAPVVAAPSSASDILNLKSDLAPDAVLQLSRDRPVYWHVDADASRAPGDGSLSISLAGAGDRALGLHAEVRTCAAAWTSTGCRAGERLLRADGPVLLDGRFSRVLTVATPFDAHLRIALTADPQTGSGANGADPGALARGSLTLRADAGEDTEQVGIGGEGPLARTGWEPVRLMAAPAAAAVGLGIALLARRRTRAAADGASSAEGNAP